MDTRRYFTLMPNVPSAINREEALSLLASVSSVVSLHLLQLYRKGSFWQRVGLVEVADKESVFRLTSRQFLLRGSHAVKHRLIPDSSLLALEFGDMDLLMHVNFYSRENSAVTRVIDFLEQFGSLNILSMKSKEGYHELAFRAAKDYSIRHHSTDLSLKVDGIFVEIHFPEGKLNYDYFAHDAVLLHALDISPLELSKPFVASADYFDPKVASTQITLASVADCDYSIEDDCLSLDEDCSNPREVDNYHAGKNALAHFSPAACRSLFTSLTITSAKPVPVEQGKPPQKPATKKRGKKAAANDGRSLLSLVWTTPSDYATVNAEVMPAIHAKWRRFVEIKDEMRRLKYQEYLLAKRKDNFSPDADATNMSPPTDL